jgi:uncharacterized repeat protein (TIGR03843 family)
MRQSCYTPHHIFAKIKATQALSVSKLETHSPDIIETLLNGKMELQGLMPWSSNYTFLADIQDRARGISLLAIYKPGEGERPLWDFPDQTLSLREFTSYLVSQVLGWPKIPPTVLREGPHGLGSVQLFIEAEYEAHYFNMRGMPTFAEDFRRMALFDFIVNNADRKGGHCLKGTDGQVWAIDHGLTFHVEPKLRTVIWEFCEETIPQLLLDNLAHLQQLMEQGEFCQLLSDLISPREVEAFKRRVAVLVARGRFPATRSGRNMPYPPI